jgi:hypothetical protein
MKSWSDNLKEKDLDMDVMGILKWNWNRMGRCGWIHLAQNMDQLEGVGAPPVNMVMNFQVQ